MAYTDWSTGANLFQDSRNPSKSSAATRNLADYGLKELFEELARQFREAERWTKRCRDSSAQQILYAFMDKLLVDENEQGMLEVLDDERIVSIPIFGAMLRMVLKERLKSNPGWCYHRGNGGVSRAAIARLCNAIVDDFSGRFFDPEFEAADHLTLHAFGTTLWDLTWNPDAGPVANNSTVKTISEAKTVCPECEYEATGYMEGQVCPIPDCVGILTDEEELKAISSPDGVVYKAGALEIRAINGFAWNTQSGAREWSKVLWLSEDFIDDIAHAADMFPDAELVQGQELTDEFLHMRRMRAVERVQAGINLEYSTLRTANEELNERERLRQTDTFKPLVYAGHTTKKGDVFPCEFEWNGKTYHKGDEIPEGTLTTDLFPDGVKVSRYGQEHVKWESCDIHKRYIIGRREVIDGCIWGKNAAGALDLQYALDEIGTIIFTYANEQAMPTMFYDEAIVDDGIGIGGRLNRIPAGNRPRDVKMSDLIAWAPPGRLGQEVLALPQMIKEDMQMVLGAFSPFGSSLPQAAEGTATGMSITEQAAASQQAMVLGLVAHTKCQAVELGLAIFNQNAEQKRYFQIGGPHTSLSSVVAIQGKDIPADIKVAVKRNSAFPRELYQQQNDILMYCQSVMMVAQAKMAVREEVDIDDLLHLGEIHQNDIIMNRAEQQAEIAQERIKKALDFITRAERFTNGDKKALLPTELKLIEEVGAELVKAQQEKLNNMVASRPIDENTGKQVSLSPEQIAKIEQLEEEAKNPPPDILYVAACDKVVPLREDLDLHGYLAKYTQKWAQEYEGRNLHPWAERWLSERFRMHKQLATETMADDFAQQQAAVTEAMMPIQEKQMMRQAQMQAATGAMQGGNAPQQQGSNGGGFGKRQSQPPTGQPDNSGKMAQQSR